jgi:type VII secretion integral membrane protein EccD
VDDERCHVTIVGTRRRVDLALPAHATIAEYTPTLLQLCGQEETDDTFPSVWSLALPGASPFAPEASLGDSGIVDGATLYLRDCAAGEFDEAVVTDLDEVVEEANRAVPAWDARQRALATVVVGLLALIAGFAALTTTGPAQPALGLAATAVGFGLALVGRQAHRKRWALTLVVRLLMALSAVPLLALAAVSLSAAGNATATALVALSIGAVIGAAAARLSVPHVTTLIALVVTGVTLPVTMALVLLHADLTESAAVVSVVTLGLLAVAPTASGQMATMAAPRTDAAAKMPSAEEEVKWLVGRSHRVLVGSNVLCAVVLAACLVVLGTAHQAFALALAACLSLALLLRSGRLKARTAVLPVIAAGTVGLGAVVAFAPGYFGAPGWVGPLVVVAAGVVAAALGTVRSFRPAEDQTVRPAWPGTLASVLSVVCVPLVGGVFGALAALVHLGESL